MISQFCSKLVIHPAENLCHRYYRYILYKKEPKIAEPWPFSSSSEWKRRKMIFLSILMVKGNSVSKFQIFFFNFLRETFMQDLYDEGDVNKSPEMTNVSFYTDSFPPWYNRLVHGEPSGHLRYENPYKTNNFVACA